MPKITMREIRDKFPMYADVPDAELAEAVRQKFYPDIPAADFNKMVGGLERGALGTPSNAEVLAGFNPSDWGRQVREAPGRIKQGAIDLAGGGVTGATRIGATLIEPSAMHKSLGYQSIPREDRIKAAIDTAQEFGADPGSLPFKTGDIGAQAAGVGGLGKLMGGFVGAYAPRVGEAIQSAGMAKNVPAAINIPAGGLLGAATAGLLNPTDESAATGGLFGMVFPALNSVVSPVANWASRRLMQSTLKPTLKQHKMGKDTIAVDTLLERGISPNANGVQTLEQSVDDINNAISRKIAGSQETVSPTLAARPIVGTAARFGNQVDPASDLASIYGVRDRFVSGLPPQIPVQRAQDIKTGTYSILRDKYGQVGTAETEAQKAIARGLKDQVAAKVPGVSLLNAEEAKLLDTLDVVERRALMQLNNNPGGLSWLAENKARMVAFALDRSAAFKALLARMIYRVNQMSQAPGVLAPTAAGIAAANKTGEQE